MIRRYRAAWYLTAAIVVAAGLVLLVRQRSEPPRDNPEGLIEPMIWALRDDPQMLKEATRRLVWRVAAYAEEGEPTRAEFYFALGLRLCYQRWYRDAEDAYRKAIALKPEWSWAYNGLGVALFSMERDQEAEAAFRKAIELDPKWSRPHNDLAILLRFADRFEEAELEAQRALELDPDDLAVHNNYGNLLVTLGRFEEAEHAYRTALHLDPTHPAPYYNLACLASLQRRADEVFSWLSKAIRLDPAMRDEALRDADFEPVRPDWRFWEIVGRRAPSTASP